MLSVVLCTYNGARYLPAQLKSIMAQTRPVDEIVIQDDGSTDGTVQICQDFADKHPGLVRFFVNQGKPLGPSKNFYSAMAKAQGNLLALCDQDDLWEPDKLRLQEAALQTSGKLLCTCRSKPFAEDGAEAYYDARRPNYTLMRMLHCAEIPGHTILMRRELLELLPKDVAILSHRMYDIVLSVVAAAGERIAVVDQVLVHQRRYTQAATYTSIDGQRATATNARKILFWCLKHYGTIKRLGAEGYLDWAELLRALPYRTKRTADAICLMELQSRSGFLNYLLTARLCLRYRYEICHTPGRGLAAIVRAIFFPLTSLWYKRGLIM